MARAFSYRLVSCFHGSADSAAVVFTLTVAVYADRYCCCRYRPRFGSHSRCRSVPLRIPFPFPVPFLCSFTCCCSRFGCRCLYTVTVLVTVTAYITVAVAAAAVVGSITRPRYLCRCLLLEPLSVLLPLSLTAAASVTDALPFYVGVTFTSPLPL